MAVSKRELVLFDAKLLPWFSWTKLIFRGGNLTEVLSTWQKNPSLDCMSPAFWIIPREMLLDLFGSSRGVLTADVGEEVDIGETGLTGTNSCEFLP